MLVDQRVPGGVFLGAASSPRLSGARQSASASDEFLDADERVADHRQRAVLDGVEAGGVERDDAGVRRRRPSTSRW